MSRKRKQEKSYDEMVAELHAYEQLEKEGYFDDIKKVEEMNIMTIHFREKPTNKQKYHIWCVPHFRIGLIRNLKARAIPVYPIAARLMTEREIEDLKKEYRNIYYGYQSWNDLMEYELKEFPDQEWEKTLTLLSKEHICTRNTMIEKNGQIRILF